MKKNLFNYEENFKRTQKKQKKEQEEKDELHQILKLVQQEHCLQSKENLSQNTKKQPFGTSGKQRTDPNHMTRRILKSMENNSLRRKQLLAQLMEEM